MKYILFCLLTKEEIEEKISSLSTLSVIFLSAKDSKNEEIWHKNL